LGLVFFDWIHLVISPYLGTPNLQVSAIDAKENTTNDIAGTTNIGLLYNKGRGETLGSCDFPNIKTPESSFTNYHSMQQRGYEQ